MKYLAFALMAVTIVAATEDGAKAKICVPGTRTKVACNDCICSMDGTAQACTLTMCLPNVPEVRNRRQATDKVCQPGETKKLDCNNCFCMDDGSGWGCTLMACPPKVCQPGTQYMKYCNMCTCADDGSVEACTRMECPKGIFNEDGSRKNPTQL